MSAKTFKDYWMGLSAQEKKDLVKRMNTSSINYLSQAAHGHKPLGDRLLSKLIKASGGEITPAMGRPDRVAMYGKE